MSSWFQVGEPIPSVSPCNASGYQGVGRRCFGWSGASNHLITEGHLQDGLSESGGGGCIIIPE